MPTHPTFTTTLHFRRDFMTMMLSVLSAMAPALVLILWPFSIDFSTSLFTGLPSMVPLTALCCLLLVLSNIVSSRPEIGGWVRIPAAAVLVFSLTLLLEYSFWFFDPVAVAALKELDPGPGLMSPQTCVALSGLAIAHLLYTWPGYRQSTRLRMVFQLLTFTALAISIVAAIGYLYSISDLFSLSSYIGMSIPTAFSIFFLALNTLRLDAQYGLTHSLGQQNSAGYFLRNFVLGGLITPFLVAGLIRWAEMSFGLDRDYGMAAFVFFTVLCIVMLGFVTTFALERLEAQRLAISAREAEVNEARETATLKDKFLVNMSHEVRTPMTAIMGYLDFIDTDDITMDMRREYTRRAKRSARSLLRVLDDILDLSSTRDHKLQMKTRDFDPRELLEDVAAQFALEAHKKGLALETHFAVSLPDRLHADPVRIQQIVTNLLQNAVKFTDYGEVRISASFEAGDAVDVGELVIDVIDTGIGIAPEMQSRLFHNFFQADDGITRRFGGIGLGLVLSANMARLLGGKIELKSSRIDQGSRFNLRIPVRALDAAAIARARAPNNVLPLLGLKILVVEDSEDNQLLIERYLSRAGAEVEMAPNGELGMEMAQANSYGLILMDLQMPVLDGLEATRRLRKKGYREPIIALSAHASSEHRQKSLEAGCNAHAIKPIDQDALIRTIRESVGSV